MCCGLVPLPLWPKPRRDSVDFKLGLEGPGAKGSISGVTGAEGGTSKGLLYKG